MGNDRQSTAAHSAASGKQPLTVPDTLPPAARDSADPQFDNPFSDLPQLPSTVGTAAEQKLRLPSDTHHETSTAELPRKPRFGEMLAGLPRGFGDPDGDWQTILGESPFERLCLDPTRPETITPDITERHYRLIESFWTEKLEALDRAAAADRIVSKYGGPTKSTVLMRSYPRRLREAWERLQSGQSIQNELARIEDERRLRGFDILRASMDDMLADNVLNKSEVERLFKKGENAGLLVEETASFIEANLRDNDFAPSTTPKGVNVSEQLKSCEWYRKGWTPPTGVRPLKIGKHRVHSVADLIEVCDAEPDEAQECLFAGYVASWLGEVLGETGLAKMARSITKNGAPDRKSLELFARELCRDQGLPAEPSLELPTSVDLGVVPIGAEQQKKIPLRWANKRRGWGTCLLTPEVPGLTVDPGFSLATAHVELMLATLFTRPGWYQTELLIQSVGGQTSRVPLSFQVPEATLLVEPTAIDFGSVILGRAYDAKITVSTIQKSAVLDVEYAVKPETSPLSVTGSRLRSECVGEVRLTTVGLRAGESRRDSITIQTNIGTAVVPIRYAVQLDNAKVAFWTGGAAVLGGALFGLVRQMIGSNPALSDWLRIETSGDFKTAGFFLGLLFTVLAGLYLKHRSRS